MRARSLNGRKMSNSQNLDGSVVILLNFQAGSLLL